MQKKYKKDGLVALTVSLDNPKEPGTEGKVLSRLRKQKVEVTNYILNSDSDEFWQKKFGIDGPPCVFVFDRAGRWKKFNAGERYSKIETFVAEFLKEKPPAAQGK
jgi:hypothetical protein